MKYKLIVFPKVYEELVEAIDYYNEQQNGLGFDLIDEWESALNTVLLNPLGFEKKQQNFRWVLLKRFPYLIIFEIIEYDIFVYRIINAKRKPTKRFRKL